MIYHLGAALAGYGQALAAAPNAGAPKFPWAEGLADLAKELGADLGQFEIASEIAGRLTATIDGIEMWQRHPYRRAVTEPPILVEFGGARLLDYGQAPEAANPTGPPVLVVPSLINRAYVLDLDRDVSFLRWLASQGVRPILLDWGAPSPEEQAFDLGAYGALRLVPALAYLRETTGQRVSVVGYCMGGALAAGLAARCGDHVERLALIGAPWDFASTDGFAGGIRAMIRARGVTHSEEMLQGLGQAFGAVPVSTFQLLFSFINPIQAALKFQRFSEVRPDGPAARRFVALEDWLADGVPMAAPAARDLLIDWQIQNLTARKAWRFLGEAVDPGQIQAPTLAFCGRRDSIAPAELSEPLPLAIPNAKVVRPDAGHVGMVAGGRAKGQVWRPMAAFLKGAAT